jgi:Pectate lyase superfamily protein
MSKIRVDSIATRADTDEISVDDIQSSAELASGAGSSTIGYTPAGTGAVATTVQTKLRESVSVRDFGADPTGVADSSAAFQAALNACTNNSELDLVGGTYLLNTAVSRSGLSRLRVIGRGAQIVEGSSAISALMTFTSCPRLRVEDIHFVGSETYAYFQANSPTSRRRFLSVITSSRVRIKDVTGQDKRGHIYLDTCTASIVENSDFVGFFQNISLGVQADGNECPSVEISGGSYNKAVRCHAENHGSCVLWGSSAIGTSATDCTGQNLHDNGVYGSSGSRGRVFGCDFSDLNGSSVKVRGSQNVVIGNTGKNGGALIGVTGNGTTADAYGANGFGNIVIGNSVTESRFDGINFSLQDGLYARDSVIAFNTINNVVATGGYGALRGTLTQGGVIAGNVCSQLACDYGILYSGTASLTTKSSMVWGNVIQDLNGAQQGIRVAYLTESLVGGNVATDVPNLVQARFTTDSAFVANVNPNGTTALGSSAANSNSNNVFVSHRGQASVDGATHANLGNFPIGTISPIASAPPALGLIAISSGNVYISIGTSSSADWKLVS